jgi:hypothetical protein
VGHKPRIEGYFEELRHRIELSIRLCWIHKP